MCAIVAGDEETHIYDTPVDLAIFRKVESDASENTAYGVLQEVPTTSNSAYGQVRR